MSLSLLGSSGQKQKSLHQDTFSLGSCPWIQTVCLENVFVVDICCGFNHSICKDSYGKVYFWGDSAWGKLGIKETKVDQCIPLEMSDMKIRNVVKMFAGPMQSAIFVSGGIMI